MLSIATVRRHRIDYYLNQTRAGGRSSGYLEEDGVFLGTLCDRLGLGRSTVEAATLRAVLEGVDPLTGEILDEAHGRVTNVAYDCMFAAPKSVSLLHGLADEEIAHEVGDAHRQSVEQALSYLEEHAGRVRRRVGGNDHVVDSLGLGAAAYEHRVSRALDPHLHSHVLVFNLATTDGLRYSALDGRGLYEHGRAAGAIYRAQLRREIGTRLGVRWDRQANGLGDVIGVPARLRRSFSTRQIEIEGELERRGHTGAHATRIAAHATRAEKSLELSYEELRERWRARAQREGFRWSSPRPRMRLDDERADVVEHAATYIGALDRPFRRAEIVQQVANQASQGMDRATVAGAVDAALKDGASPLRAPRASASRTRRRVPVPESELTYESYAALERRASRDALFASLPVPSLGQPLCGQFVLAVGHDRICAADALRAVVSPERDRRAHAPLVALSSTYQGANEVEALTGIPAVRVGARPPLLPGAVVVVDDARRVEPSFTLAMHHAASMYQAVIYLDRRNDERQTLRDLLDPGVVPVVRRAGAVEVTLVDRAAQIPSALEDLSETLEANGPRPIILGDPRSTNSCPFDVRRIVTDLANDSTRKLIVVGSARVLGQHLDRVDDARRIHLAVAGPGNSASAESRQVVAIAEPLEARRRLGRLPLELGNRERWLSRAIGGELAQHRSPRREREGIERMIGR